MEKLPIKPWMDRMFIDEHQALINILDSQQVTASLPQSIDIISAKPLDECKVLDLCCGHGRVARTIAPYAREVVGVDFSKPFIQKAIELSAAHRNIRWIEGDARAISKLDVGGFDLIIRLYTSVGYFDYENELTILRECATVASPKNAQLIYDSFNACWFRQNQNFRRERECNGILLTEEYTIESDRGEEYCQCLWSSPAFQQPISFRLELYDEIRMKQLFSESDWHIRRITPTLVSDQQPEKPWERLVIDAVLR